MSEPTSPAKAPADSRAEDFVESECQEQRVPQLKSHKHIEPLLVLLTKEHQGPLADGRLLHAWHAVQRRCNHSHTPEDKTYEKAASHTAFAGTALAIHCQSGGAQHDFGHSSVAQVWLPLQGLHQPFNSISHGTHQCKNSHWSAVAVSATCNSTTRGYC